MRKQTFYLLDEEMLSWILKDNQNLTRWNNAPYLCHSSLVCLANQQFPCILLSKNLVTWWSEVCYLSWVNFGGRKKNKKKTMVSGMRSLWCWRWKSKAAFNHSALLAAVRIVGSQIIGHKHIQNFSSEEVICLWSRETHLCGHEEGEVRSHNCPLAL